MLQTHDLHVMSMRPLPTPDYLRKHIPATESMKERIVESRRIIGDIIHGRDKRMLMIVGPCSIHDADEALEYARRLHALHAEVCDTLYIVMRTFFAKPRTTIGWKGLLYDPDMDGSDNIATGLARSRMIATAIVEMGLPVSMEAVDPISVRYLTDVLSWASVGARTIESQPHRELASGLSMPVGLKNSTDGNVKLAIDALHTVRSEHSFIGVNDLGMTVQVRTKGNLFGHVVLRGGSAGPNFDSKTIQATRDALHDKGLTAGIMIDCSHGNSSKEHEKQIHVLQDIVQQRLEGCDVIIGAMIESYLEEGNQQIPVDLSQLKRGVSVTDACLGWDTTERVLRETCVSLRRAS